jgi:hypothetical protein
VLSRSQESDPHSGDQVGAAPALRLGRHADRGVQGAETTIAAPLDNFEKEPIFEAVRIRASERAVIITPVEAG